VMMCEVAVTGEHTDYNVHSPHYRAGAQQMWRGLAVGVCPKHSAACSRTASIISTCSHKFQIGHLLY